jgi:putative endonuclease
MVRYATYILHCADDSYYTGMTNNLERRMEEHEEGINEDSYTANRKPVKLVWWQDYQYVDQAIAREKQIKGWSRAKKEALIAERREDLPLLSKKKFQTKK